ncbi:hypothetical protein [Methylorubrum aminovorans]|uniref:hypothetical protein n=1 Tax=Methylorubrum aminovorans TaxID=269069 RepID=UPI003C30BF3C
MRLVRTGMTYVDVGLRFNVPVDSIARIARAHGYDATKRIKLQAQKRAEMQARQRAQRAFERAQIAAERARKKGERDPMRRLPTVPAWVAVAGLTQDYRDLAREFDEDHAARECRKLTAALRQMEALDACLGAAA